MIAPHEITDTQLSKITEHSPLPVLRYTHCTTPQPVAPSALFVLDTIGQLSAAYQYGDIAFIGGGFDTGIHNILEPAAFGLPILFGPRYQKFQEAKDLIEQGGAVVVLDSEDLVSIFEQWVVDAERIGVSGVNWGYVNGNVGGTKNILRELSI